MNRRNYQRELDRIIQKRGKKYPRVLLHACCGPCSSSVLEYLTQYFDVTILWYNPNIYPREEFDKRFKNLVKVVEGMGLADKVSIMAEPWKSEEYYRRVRGLEDEPEGGRRCGECFRLRLLETAKIAKQYGFDYFCSTLTLSRHKNAVLINDIGEEIARAVGVSWLPSEFKKRDREARSLELCEKYGIYRQLYCGCEFSLRRREAVAEERLSEEKNSEE
ncbi:MAG: epoxyqueuosine reductase QueH [Candidatus Limivicinus sp.]